MHILFLSDSKNVARRRVAQVLDNYAYRIARDTWEGHFTQKGLQIVRKQLLQIVEPGVSVLCRVVEGFSRKKSAVQWIIGNDSRFCRENGSFATNAKRSTNHAVHRRSDISSLIVQLAYWAGKFHDLGKNHKDFQEKLQKEKRIADPVRHELFSFSLLQGDWEHLGEFLFRLPQNTQRIAAEDLLPWVVFSHHRLPGEHWDFRENKHVLPEYQPYVKQVSPVDRQSYPDWSDFQAALFSGTHKDFPATALPVVSWYARWAMILGDHWVSGLPADPQKGERYATKRIRQYLQHPRYAEYRALANGHQKLRGHLDAVGFAARWSAKFLTRKDALPRTLPQIPTQWISDAAGREGRFAWQGEAVDAVAEKTAPHHPALCFVVSETGTGKTQGCAALADALCARKGMGVRATVALGLRNLTLQTGDVYRERLALENDQLSVVIGDRMTQTLHSATREEGSPEEGLFAEDPVWETDQSFWRKRLREGKRPGCRLGVPQFLVGNLNEKTDPGFFLSPILVCTIDQIIQAADLSRSAWVLPVLRVASGPLILDELDQYDLSDFLPILRLVYLTGLLGQDLIVSTATLYPAFAEAVQKAYQEGVAQYALLQGDEEIISQTGIFHNRCPVHWWNREEEFSLFWQSWAEKIAQPQTPRYAQVLPEYTNIQHFWEDLPKKIVELHKNHASQTDIGEFSVGMIRLAHIRDVMAVTRNLTKRLPDSMDFAIIPYHSRNFSLSRAYIEYRLDRMLQRNADPYAPLLDADFRERVCRAKEQGKPFCLLVVCSPVEEVGRDHDFDWAILEPSSTRSIIQCAGRVWRHRVAAEMATPNVFVLDRPLRSFREPEKPYYNHPGFEVQEPQIENNQWSFRKYQHRIAHLLEMQEPSFLQASWCLAPKRPLPKIEDQKIKEYLGRNFTESFLENPYAVLQSKHFTDHRFRNDDIAEESWYFDIEDRCLRDTEKNRENRFVVIEEALPRKFRLFQQSFSDVLDFWENRTEKQREVLLKSWNQIRLPVQKEGEVDLLYGWINEN